MSVKSSWTFQINGLEDSMVNKLNSKKIRSIKYINNVIVL
jgi:hypothetical protein